MKIYKNTRLRVLDLNTPWFWFTIFYQPFAYGESWLRIELWEPYKWRKWWFHFWQWEVIPDSQNMFGEQTTQREQDL